MHTRKDKGKAKAKADAGSYPPTFPSQERVDMELHALPNRLAPDSYTYTEHGGYSYAHTDTYNGGYPGNYDVNRGYGGEGDRFDHYPGSRRDNLDRSQGNPADNYTGNRYGYGYEGNRRENYDGGSGSSYANNGGYGFVGNAGHDYAGNSDMDGANSYRYADDRADTMDTADGGHTYAGASGYQYITVTDDNSGETSNTSGSSTPANNTPGNNTSVKPANTPAEPAPAVDAPKKSLRDTIKRKLSLVEVLTHPIRAHRRRKEEEERREQEEIYNRMYGFLSRAEFPSASFDPKLSPGTREVAAELEDSGGGGRRWRRRGTEGRKK